MSAGALIHFVDRPSDSPFIERVWRSHSDRAGVFHSIAACHWVMVVTRLEGRISLAVRGPETKATMFREKAGETRCLNGGKYNAVRELLIP